MGAIRLTYPAHTVMVLRVNQNGLNKKSLNVQRYGSAQYHIENTIEDKHFFLAMDFNDFYVQPNSKCPKFVWVPRRLHELSLAFDSMSLLS